MTDDLRAAFARRSNEAWRDAHAPEGVLSASTRAKCLFDAGYFALLANAPADARARVTHHPECEFIRVECRESELPAGPGIHFVVGEHSALDEDRPSQKSLLEWAERLRSALL